MTMPKKGWRHSDESKAKMRVKRGPRPWGDAHKKAHLETVQTQEYRDRMSLVKSGVALPIDSKAGAGENNKNAKLWWFRKDGVNYRFKSLNKFVRDNKHLFSDEELTEYRSEKRAAPVYRATVMLRNLHLLKKDGTPLVPSNEWSGWTIGDKHDAKPTAE
jgi:hypothetical protein